MGQKWHTSSLLHGKGILCRERDGNIAVCGGQDLLLRPHSVVHFLKKRIFLRRNECSSESVEVKINPYGQCLVFTQVFRFFVHLLISVVSRKTDSVVPEMVPNKNLNR